MEVLTVQNIGAAVQALQQVARYDAMRLETYRRKEDLEDRIRISPLGSALALRFDDVGYFNRVYCADADVLERLPEIEQVYSGSPFGCEVVCLPADPPDSAA